VAAILNSIGLLLDDVGRYDEAAKVQEESLGIYRRLRGEDHEFVAETLISIGDARRGQGEVDEAIKRYKEAIEVQRRVYGQDHEKVAETLASKIGLSLAKQGKNAEAATVFEESLEVYTRALGTNHKTIAQMNIFIATAKEQSGDVAGALRYSKESVRMYARLGITDQDAKFAARVMKKLSKAQGEA